MKYLKLIIIIFPLILAVIFLILFVNINRELEQTRNQLNKTIEKYSKEKDELISENNKLKSTEPDIENKSEKSIYLYKQDIEGMKKKGLDNPVRNIISSLMEHNELLPYEGVLGGTMRFYENKVKILTDKWVLAYFEDGHIGGYLLLEYNISDDGRITWKRISSMLS